MDYPITIRNSSLKRITVVLEPHGEEHLLNSGKALRLHVEGPSPESPRDLEVQYAPDKVTVYGWNGGTLSMLDEA